jgi:hypothetical protein
MTRDEVLFELYGPQALQYTHVMLYAADEWTVPLDRSVKEQARSLLSESNGDSDTLLSL